jgi:HEAT repeat protein
LLERCYDDDENVRCAALEHIPYLDDDRVAPILGAALKDAPAKVRASAARALAHLDAAAALPHLISALNDDDQWVRYFAARSIGVHGYIEGLEALAKLATSDEATHVRIAAMESLGRVGGARAVAVLSPLAESPEPEVARFALTGLGLIDHSDSLGPLLKALDSPDPFRRVDALKALGVRGGEGVVEGIQWVAAKDQEPAVVEAAIDSLRRLGTAQAVAALISLTAEATRREAVIDTISQLGEERIEEIGGGLTHAQAGVRGAVVEALGRMKHLPAAELLADALDDQDPAVRIAAANGLARLASRSAERKLVSMSRTDPDAAVRRAAQKALRR